MKALFCLIVTTTLATGCGSPTSPEPLSSSLVYTVPAGLGHAAASGNYTEANASFGGNVRTTCVPDPNIAGSTCPDLMVMVRPFTGTFCQLLMYAPTGQRLTGGTFTARRFPSADVAGFDMNCARGGTACNASVGRFTIHQLQSNSDGVITRFHIIFEQTCSNLDGTTYGAGTMNGELRIVNGTKGFFDR